VATSITNTSVTTDDLTVDTNVLHVDSANNRVGIGTATPTQATLHVAGGGVPARFEGDTGTTYVQFGASATTNYGQIAMTGNDMTLRTAYQDRMTIDTNGYVTIPNQPSWNLRPNSGSNVTMGQSDEIIGWTTASNTGGNAFLNGGVTLSASNSGTMNANSSGRINLPIAGKYKVWCTIRCENTPGTGNIYLSKNGTTIARQHVEVWARYNYGHGFLSLILDCAANDYLEWRVARANGIVSGYSDTVNWAGGFLIG